MYEIDLILPKENITIEEAQKLLSKIKEEFFQNKFIPECFELPFYIAISKYPEMKKTKITTFEKSFGLTLQAQPDFDFLFINNKKRSYHLNINIDHSKAHGVLFTELPFDAQVGIMAHELSHILDYQKMSKLKLLHFSVMYLCIKFRKRLERHTDQVVIERGLGWQLYDWADFAMYRSGSPRRHKYYKHGYYLLPEEILDEMRSFPKLYPEHIHLKLR